MSTGNYIIDGGAEGKARLARLGGVLNTGTLHLLQCLQPNAVDRFLDLGCGAGSLSIAVAQSGWAREVVGIDFDAAMIDAARRDAADAGVAHAAFFAGNATELALDQPVDVAYARFLLSHMTDPELVLRRMIGATKPGGLVLVEDVDFAGHYCFPANSAFERYVEAYTLAARQRGQNPEIGRSLFALLQNGGLERVDFDVIQPVFHNGSGKWMAFDTLARIGGALLQQGILTEGELSATLEALRSFTEDPRSIISMPRIFRVWGRVG